jgi:hypothetical protein
MAVIGVTSSKSSYHLVRLVPDESDDHAVEVEEEHQEMEAEFDERFLFHC